MDIRDRILDAARRVYAQHGFRGATTRLIANEAEVNEVTLFRTFGSKEALFGELMRLVAQAMPIPPLPDVPRDPQAELSAWATAVLAQMHEMRAILRKAIAEMEDRPESAVAACEAPHCAGAMLREYAHRLVASGMADPLDEYLTPVFMLMGALWSDTMSRDILPDVHAPIGEAPALYVRTFLRAVGYRPAGHSAHDNRVPAPAERKRRGTNAATHHTAS